MPILAVKVVYLLQDDMRSYDMEFVIMKIKKKQFLSLQVPGLAERRPSLVTGDYIYANLASEDTSKNVPYQVCLKVHG